MVAVLGRDSQRRARREVSAVARCVSLPEPSERESALECSVKALGGSSARVEPAQQCHCG